MTDTELKPAEGGVVEKPGTAVGVPAPSATAPEAADSRTNL